MRQREVDVALYDTRHKMASPFFPAKNGEARKEALIDLSVCNNEVGQHFCYSCVVIRSQTR
jgi:hypothetical protein